MIQALLQRTDNVGYISNQWYLITCHFTTHAFNLNKSAKKSPFLLLEVYSVIFFLLRVGGTFKYFLKLF